MTNQNSKLELKSINQLLDNSFFIPAYQRGYRWSKTQVEQLLNDIWDFANPTKNIQTNASSFYCLQPIVVKKQNEIWEVIDGQQRLTTIYLILKHLEHQIERDQKNFTGIFYETRPESEDFLKNIATNESKKDDNIDFYHLSNAYETIHEWFRNKANTTKYATPKARIAPVLLEHTKFIWYEAEENNHSVDIFTRLNMGKIPLTNGELIKALFLRKTNFSENQASLQQIQIASEWDMIEKKLQNDAFWFFIYSPAHNTFYYNNRIEYVLDLIKERNENSEYYHTFNKYYELFLTKNNDFDIAKLWLEIKKYFLTLEEWFTNNQLYHYIGFLIDCGISINTIKKEFTKVDKNQFYGDFLKQKIIKQINCTINNINEIVYGDKRVKKILLLLNIQTLVQSNASDMRFPFHKYKSENWDIEHVRSQTDKIIRSEKHQQAWITDMLDYFGDAKATKDKKAKIISDLSDLKNAETIEQATFDEIFQQVQQYFKEDKGDKEDKDTVNIDSLSNLTLLDSKTNRSYGNAFFPIKRQRIIDNDKKGLFIPIATKNLFLKYYSKKLDDVMYWKKEDAADYLDEIKTTLADFLPESAKK